MKGHSHVERKFLSLKTRTEKIKYLKFLSEYYQEKIKNNAPINDEYWNYSFSLYHVHRLLEQISGMEGV